MKKQLCAFLAAVMIVSAAGFSEPDAVGALLDGVSITADAADSFTDGAVKIDSAYAASAQAIKITWQKVDGAEGYRVFRYTSSGWKVLGNVTSTAYYEGKLESGTAYNYIVRAYKKSGSSYVWTKVGDIKHVVTKPKNIAFTSSWSADASSITLGWGVQKSNGYQVFKRVHGTAAWTYAGSTNHMSKTTFKAANLTAGTEYDFAVRAIRKDADGNFNCSGYTIATYSTAPANVTFVKTVTPRSSTLQFSWNKVQGATGYRVYRHNGKSWTVLGDVGSSVTSYTDKNLSANTQYRYTVRAIRTYGDKTLMSPGYYNKYASTTVTIPNITYIDATPLCVLMAPASINESENITGYEIYYRQSGASNWTLYQMSATGHRQAFYVKNLTPGKTYQILIRKYIKNDSEVIRSDNEIHTVTVPATYASGEYAKQVYQLVNEHRKANGVAALTLDPTLCSLAMIRSYEQLEFFGHTRPDGSSCFTVANEYGISGGFWAENAAQGAATPDRVMQLWKNSSGHNRNMLNSSYTKIGVGYCKKYNCWIQVFA